MYEPMRVELMVELLRCEKCGHRRYSAEAEQLDDAERPCAWGNCVEMCCVNCGHSSSGFGPVGCRCQSRYWRVARRVFPGLIGDHK